MTLSRPPKVGPDIFNTDAGGVDPKTLAQIRFDVLSATDPRKTVHMFTHSPPDQDIVALPILRCVPNGHLDVILSCRLFTGVMTHWVNNATTLHAGVGRCEGCSINQAPRWQGFIIVRSPDSGMSRLFQFTPPVARVLESHKDSGDGLLGLVVRVKRLGKNDNSPLHASVIDYADHADEFAFADLQKAVARLFRSNFHPLDAARKSIGSLPVE